MPAVWVEPCCFTRTRCSTPWTHLHPLLPPCPADHVLCSPVHAATRGCCNHKPHRTTSDSSACAIVVERTTRVSAQQGPQHQQSSPLLGCLRSACVALMQLMVVRAGPQQCGVLPCRYQGGAGCAISLLGVLLVARPPFLFGGNQEWAKSRSIGTAAGVASAGGYSCHRSRNHSISTCA
jgi:hypothetical protein